MSTKNRVLLTGARAMATLDLARKFKYWGHEVYVADSVKYHLCRYSSAVKKSFLIPSPAQCKSDYIHTLSELIKQYDIDLLIPTCEEIFYISSELGTLNRLTSVFSDRFERLILLHNKFSFNKLIEVTNEKRSLAYSEPHFIFVPKTLLITSLSEYHRLVQEGEITYPHVLKPAYSRFGTRVRYVFKPEIIELNISEDNPWVVQTYIAGQVLCTYSICHKGSLLANVFYKNHYSAGKNGAGISFEYIENVHLFQWVSQLVKRLNYTGQIAFDVIKANDGSLWPIECNPRLTSGIHLMEHQQNIPSVFLTKNKLINKAIKTQYHPILSLAMLLYGLLSTKSCKEILAWVKCFLKGKDVVFRWTDPFILITQFLAMINFFNISRKHRITFLEATTYDIEWNGRQ